MSDHAKKPHSRFAVARGLLLFWCLFIGLGAVAGATGMLSAPDGSALGMQSLLPYFQVLPFAPVLFRDYVFPGIALLLVNGLPNLLAAYLLLRRRDAGVTLGGVFGVTLMLWICIQFVIFPANVLSISYFIFGLAQAATGFAAHIFRAQERFFVRAEDYPHIGADPTRLVVFFSRLGYTRRAAYEEAERTGAALLELRAAERTEGTPGFWWCGRYGMHRWPMPLQPYDADLARYAHVTVCSPIWVFSLSAPVRRFCADAHGRIGSADYVFVHHMNLRYEAVAREMDGLLGLRAGRVRSVTCHAGRVRRDVTVRETPAAARS